MKTFIIAMLIGAIGVCSGYTLRGRIDRYDRNLIAVRVEDIIKEATTTYQEIYDGGFHAGLQEGFQVGYQHCWNGVGLKWFGSYERFGKFAQEYGSIHNTPWKEFTIEEKATIAMYGGSGSKLEQDEINEWVNKYGVKR